PERPLDRTGRVEEERLHERVIPGMAECASQAQEPTVSAGQSLTQDGEPQVGAGKTLPKRAKPQAYGGDADVLEAAIRERSLQVALSQGIGHSQDCRSRPGEEQKPAPPGRRVWKEARHPNERIESHFVDHAGKECRNVARAARGSPRQEEVERHEAALEAEARDRKEEQRRCDSWGEDARLDRPKGEGPRRPV